MYCCTKNTPLTGRGGRRQGEFFAQTFALDGRQQRADVVVEPLEFRRLGLVWPRVASIAFSAGGERRHGGERRRWALAAPDPATASDGRDITIASRVPPIMSLTTPLADGSAAGTSFFLAKK
jgi:hypothetical protein